MPAHRETIHDRNAVAAGPHFCALPEDALLARLHSSESGLSRQAAARRLAALGPNRLATTNRLSRDGACAGRDVASRHRPARQIDRAVRELGAAAFGKALALLQAHRDLLERGARLLLEKETIVEDDLKAIRNRISAPEPFVAHA